MNQTTEKYITPGYTDVTNELDQLTRGLLSYPVNCNKGLFVGGSLDGRQYLRNSNSDTMKSDEAPGEIYVRTAEVFEKDGFYHVVYRYSETHSKLTPSTT